MKKISSDYINYISNNIDFNTNSFNDFGNGIILTNGEIDILNKYKIDYKNCMNLKSLIFKIEKVIEENDGYFEDLDYIEQSISERDYYQNTNK